MFNSGCLWMVGLQWLNMLKVILTSARCLAVYWESCPSELCSHGTTLPQSRICVRLRTTAVSSSVWMCWAPSSASATAASCWPRTGKDVWVSIPLPCWMRKGKLGTVRGLGSLPQIQVLSFEFQQSAPFSGLVVSRNLNSEDFLYSWG